ncbi:hypothetical protein L596_021697 [Steinernema carpocapsae]|uniref:LysM domain-containing protein n=1 Tax=Steinernema carpocapsae TaxID=34508 RepID=A0A4U5MJI9_STECR|nr:hypothetical protein L596_021697 [Steinernema carpocapsae]
MHYEVKDNDTLERIAAAHDCTVGELMKLNKMASRMVFPGQKILVPAPLPDDVFVDAPSAPNSSSSTSNHKAPHNLGIYLGDSHGLPPNNDSFAEGKTRGPGGAVPIQSTNSKNNSPDEKTIIVQERIVDSDCLQRFLKIKVKQMTESDGTVSGTLLVTPNCLMFDPDVQHPLVIENGSDLYGMVANMEEILSVSVYKDIDGLTGAKATKKRSVFDPDHLRSPEEPVSSAPIVEVDQEPEEGRPKFVGGDSGSESFESALEDQNFPSGTSLSGSGQMLTSIVEEDHHQHQNVQANLLRPTEKYGGSGKRRTVSDVTCEQSKAYEEEQENLSVMPMMTAGSETDVVDRPRSHAELEASTSIESTTSLPGTNNNNNNEKSSFFSRGSRYSPNLARRSFGRLGRTLSARANSVKGTVVSGTKTVVSHTKSAAGQVQTGIQSGARVIAQAPNNMVKMGSGLLQDVQEKPSQLMEMCDSFFSLERTNSEQSQSNATMKREQSLATLENLKQRTQQVREENLKKAKESMFSCATSTEEMPDLFKPIGQMISQSSDSELVSAPPELPYYMTVRLDKVKKKAKGKYSISSTSSYDEDCKFGNRRKREFWYAIPRAKADAIYHFLLHWSPEKYGQDTLTNEESEAAKKNAKSFLVLEDDSLTISLQSR